MYNGQAGVRKGTRYPFPKHPSRNALCVGGAGHDDGETMTERDGEAIEGGKV